MRKQQGAIKTTRIFLNFKENKKLVNANYYIPNYMQISNTKSIKIVIDQCYTITMQITITVTVLIL